MILLLVRLYERITHSRIQYNICIQSYEEQLLSADEHTHRFIDIFESAWYPIIEQFNNCWFYDESQFQ